jgi:hypothetical protein
MCPEGEGDAEYLAVAGLARWGLRGWIRQLIRWPDPHAPWRKWFDGAVLNGVVHAAAMTFDLHVPESRSLKAKRAVIRPVVDGLRHRYHLSVAETGYLDQWQRAEIAVAVVAASDDRVREVLDTVERFVANAAGVELLGSEVAWLDADGLLGPDEAEVRS